MTRNCSGDHCYLKFESYEKTTVMRVHVSIRACRLSPKGLGLGGGGGACYGLTSM